MTWDFVVVIIEVRVYHCNMDYRISLAPLEGITTAIYRRNIDKYFGGIDRFYTPFISADSSYNFRKREIEELEPYDDRLVPQLIANNPKHFIYGARTLVEFGYNEADLNMGCPSGTVVSKHKGSGMLEDLDALRAFFDRVFSEEDLPDISVKARIGMEDDSRAEELAQLLASYPICHVIIHPRTRADFYRGLLNMDAFRRMADILGWERVTYNGDIRSVADFERIRGELPECRSFMIGRGLIADPSLARQIRAATTGSHTEQGDGDSMTKQDLSGRATNRELADFLDSLWADYEARYGGEKQLLDKMKELWTYIGERFPDKKRAVKELKKARRAADYRAAVREILGA